MLVCLGDIFWFRFLVLSFSFSLCVSVCLLQTNSTHIQLRKHVIFHAFALFKCQWLLLPYIFSLCAFAICRFAAAVLSRTNISVWRIRKKLYAWFFLLPHALSSSFLFRCRNICAPSSLSVVTDSKCVVNDSVFGAYNVVNTLRFASEVWFLLFHVVVAFSFAQRALRLFARRWSKHSFCLFFLVTNSWPLHHECEEYFWLNRINCAENTK